MELYLIPQTSKKHLMKKIYFFFLVIIFNISFLQAQKAETRLLSAFTMVRTADNITVVLVPSDEDRVDIDAQNIMMNHVLTDVIRNEFKITTQGSMNNAKITCKLYYTKELVKLTPTYGGLISTDSGTVLHAKKLEIDANLDGFVNLDVDVDELVITAGQGSDLYIRGRAGKVTVDATSGAKVHTADLACENASVKSSLGAKVWLTASNDYVAKAITGGKIMYARMPAGKFEQSGITGGKVLME